MGGAQRQAMQSERQPSRPEVWRRLDVRDEEAFEEAFSQRWGYPYVFSLAGAVNSQEEYNVPWEAFEELVTGLGFKVLLDGRFPEIYSAYAERSRFYKGAPWGRGWLVTPPNGRVPACVGLRWSVAPGGIVSDLHGAHEWELSRWPGFALMPRGGGD